MIAIFIKPPNEPDRCGDPDQKGQGVGAVKDRRSSLATMPDRYHPLRLSRLYVR
jgi:hypothetical protein